MFQHSKSFFQSRRVGALRLAAFLAFVSFLPVTSWATPFVIDVANDTGGPGGFSTISNFSLGQTYVPGASFLDHVELMVNKQTAQDVTFHVNIRETGPIGTILGVSDPFTVTQLGGSMLAHVEFASLVAITSGATQFMEIVQTSAGSLGVFFSTPYADGMAYNEFSGGFDSTKDLWFRTGAAAPVPEPSTIILMSSGLAVIFAFRKKMGGNI